jgi:hypothetical protein
MANEEHLARLKQGVEAWNQWRMANLEIQPPLAGAHLAKAQPASRETLLVNSVETLFAGVWEGPTGREADSPVRRYDPHEIATWGRS